MTHVGPMRARTRAHAHPAPGSDPRCGSHAYANATIFRFVATEFKYILSWGHRLSRTARLLLTDEAKQRSLLGRSHARDLRLFIRWPRRLGDLPGTLVECSRTSMGARGHLPRPRSVGRQAESRGVLDTRNRDVGAASLLAGRRDATASPPRPRRPSPDPRERSQGNTPVC